MPSVRASSPMRAMSVRRPSTGCRSSLKSPEWRITPWGVWKAMAMASGTEWVTGMNSTSQAPICTRSPSRHRDERGVAGQPGLLDPVPGQADRQLGAVDGRVDLPQQVGQAAGVVLVAVREHDAVDPVLAVVQVGELGQDQVDAGHVRVGEHDPAVEDDDAALDLDAGAVPADLARARPGRRPGPVSPSACCRGQPSGATVTAGGPTAARIFCAWASSSGVDGAHGQAALADAQAQRPQHRLGRQRVGELVGGLEVEGVEQLGVAGDGRGQVAGHEGVDDLAELGPDPVGGHADDADRADGHEGQRHDVVAAVDLEARRHLRGKVRRAGRIGRRVLERHDGRHLAGQPEHGRRGDAPPGAAPGCRRA